MVDFNQNRKNETSFYGEAVRLSNELRAKPETSVMDRRGNTIIYPAKWGFDIETCSINDINTWLNDRTIKKSQSLVMFVFRVIFRRFPAEWNLLKSRVHPLLLLELEMIESESKNETEWIGRVGYQNNVRLDGSLTNDRIRTIIKDDGIITKIKY